MARTRTLWLLMMLSVAGIAANADVYSFIDANGVAHYTNVPTDPRYEFLLAGPEARTRSGEPYDPVLLALGGQFDPIIERAALAAAVDADLLRAVIAVESGFDANARSRRGAVGLMQLMPATARRFGAVDRYDPGQNIHAGARYLASLIARYGKDVSLALAAYNAGEGAVDRCGGCIPPYKETQAYVPRVMRVYRALLGESGES